MCGPRAEGCLEAAGQGWYAAAGLLAFALSVDDFVITDFNAGTVTTFPLFVWGAARVAVPPQINVVGTAIFVVAVGGMLANVLLQNRRARNA
jgi:spermidine/putrescine transport system permease protein